MATQVKVLENHGVYLRKDVRLALLASQDEYILSRQALFKPQLLYAVKWVQSPHNNSSKSEVRLMGWASLGMSWMAHILGMFVVTNEQFIFLRDNHTKATDHPIQIYDIPQMHDCKISSASGGFKKLTFRYGKDHRQVHSIERLHAENAKSILALLRHKS